MRPANQPQLAWRLLLSGVAAAVLAGCAVRPLPPYNPAPLPMPGETPTKPQPNTPPPADGGVISTPVPGGPSSSTQAEQIVTMAAELAGAEVSPPTGSAATGTLAAVYNRTTRLLRWKMNANGLQGRVTGMSFNGPADLDQNGPVVIEWRQVNGPGYEGRATLSMQQASELLAGTWYVNVRTSSYPTGEIRGQMTIRY